MRKIVKLFKEGNVCVVGERGAGKDMLIANVVTRRREPYISNVEYKPKRKKGQKYYKLDFSMLEMGGNTYKDFMANKVKKYIFPYPRGTDIYISDVGVYMPSQYCNELNREYKTFPAFMALSRQVAGNNVHINVQNLNRAWDKIREQSRTYITCISCNVIPIFKKQLVIQRIRLYEKYESCIKNIPPLRLPFLMRHGKDNLMARLYKLNYEIQHGIIKPRLLIYWNKSDYNTCIFKEILENGV